MGACFLGAANCRSYLNSWLGKISDLFKLEKDKFPSAVLSPPTPYSTVSVVLARLSGGDSFTALVRGLSRLFCEEMLSTSRFARAC